MPDTPSPTQDTYQALTTAYDFFNERLFGNRLPRCLITMQRRQSAFGYFSGERFGTPDGKEVTDEIALNPSHFRERTTPQTLSTLVHEMTHLEQHHFGHAPKRPYHNREWAALMHGVGLHPSSTGQPGGKETGRRVSHYILPGGAFDLACQDLIAGGFALRYVELAGDQKKAARAASRIKYICTDCELSAWGKPAINLVCGECQKQMEPEDQT